MIAKYQLKCDDQRKDEIEIETVSKQDPSLCLIINSLLSILQRLLSRCPFSIPGWVSLLTFHNVLCEIMATMFLFYLSSRLPAALPFLRLTIPSFDLDGSLRRQRNESLEEC